MYHNTVFFLLTFIQLKYSVNIILRTETTKVQIILEFAS